MQNSLETMIDQAQIPGIAVTVMSSSRNIVTQAAGVTDKITSQVVTDTTVFEAASLSKPVFAYLLIKMSERGEFDLDKPLHEYVPNGFGPPEMRGYDLELMSNQEVKTNKLYIELIDGPILRYKVTGPDGKLKEGQITCGEINNLQLPDPITSKWLNEKEVKAAILEVTSKRGHTQNLGHDNYKSLTARMVLSHQAGLPNEFTSPESLKYISAVGEKFDYSGVAYQFLGEVVENITSKSLETLAQEEFDKIGMTNSSFMPPTGCSLIRLSDDDQEPTPESVQKLLKNTLDRHGQISIIFHKDKVYVAEREENGSVQITEKNSNKVGESNLREIKNRFAQIPKFFWSKPIPVEARELPLVTAIIGHSPKHAATIAVGHDQDGSVNLKQKFYMVHPAGSLYTNAADYGKFLRECTTDKFVQQEMLGMVESEEDHKKIFVPIVPSLVDKDSKAIDKGVSPDVLNQLAWGVGIGLQRNPDGSFIAFHWGDNGTGRNFAAINLSSQQTVVCFTNSANGPLVFQKIAEPVVGSLTPVSQWLSRREELNFNPTSIYRSAIANVRDSEQKDPVIVSSPNPLKTTPY